MTDRTVTAEELDRYERAIRELVTGLGIDYIAAAHLAAVDLREPGWLFIFETTHNPHSTAWKCGYREPFLTSQYISDPYDCWAALWCERHLYAVELIEPTTHKESK